jgi:hypothetical protein
MDRVINGLPDRLYQDGYIFAGNSIPRSAKSSQICAILVILEPTPISDPPNFARKLLI